MKELIKWKGISFGYQEEKKVLKDVDLSIQKGEKIVVIGSNGAGKSTLFLLLNGILKPESGSYAYKGREIHYSKQEMRMLRKEIGIVFQEPDQQIVSQTVFHEVAFGLMNLGYSKEEVKQRVLAMLEKLNIQDLKDCPPHYLSGGQKKSVTIADILVMEPEVLLFDEPTASLDPLNQENVERILGQIANEGKTIVVSTHDMEFASRFADRILVVGEGTIIGNGTPMEIFSDKNLLSRAFVKPPVLYEIMKVLKEKKILPNDLELTDSEKLIQFLHLFKLG
ncbi:MAG: energy-coupling factor ABC transporter ATP-binding protein [Anaerostipes sp.]|nr:energy-coupling factor ABC transporter ATP-binding protein [Anaerostipes sp.]MDD5970054.1 ABC transporter ATP-binding protein [Anaerostipes sp.]